MLDFFLSFFLFSVRNLAETAALVLDQCKPALHKQCLADFSRLGVEVHRPLLA